MASKSTINFRPRSGMAITVLKNFSFIVTGATGRLGSHLIPHLQTRGEVIKVGRNDLEPTVLRSLARKLGPNTFFIHLAWPVSKEDYLNNQDNYRILKLSTEILLNLSDLPVNIIAAGSILEAGNVAVIGDRIVPNPESLYAESKVKLQEFLTSNLSNSNLWARISYQISSHDPKHKLTPFLIENRKNDFTLSKGNDSLDFIHVSDVATAFAHTIDNFTQREDQIVVGVGRGIKVIDFARRFNPENEINTLERKANSSITMPVALTNSGWAPKFISAEDLYTAVILEKTEMSILAP